MSSCACLWYVLPSFPAKAQLQTAITSSFDILHPLQVVEEFEGSQQQLLIKSAEVIDLQSQLKDVQLQHETQLVTAEGQVWLGNPGAAWACYDRKL